MTFQLNSGGEWVSALWKELRRKALQAERIAHTNTCEERMGYGGFKELRRIQSGWNDKSQGDDVCDMDTKIAT